MSKGATAMRHAQALAEQLWPGAPALNAMKNIVWIPDKKLGRRPITKREDIFGCFDLLVLEKTGKVELIQVTTWTGGGGVASRRQKVTDWVAGFPFGVPWNWDIQVWAWVRRQHMRRWLMEWDDATWREVVPLRSPLLANGDQEEAPLLEAPSESGPPF